MPITQSYLNIMEYPFSHLILYAGGFFLTYETSWSLQYFISLEWKQFLTGISKSDLNNNQIQHSNKHLVTFFKFSSWNKVVPISQNLSYGKNSKTSSKNSRWPFVSCRLNTVCPGDKFLCSKFSPNFMAYFRGLVSHLSWVIIHHIKSTTYDYYHAKWF